MASDYSHNLPPMSLFERFDIYYRSCCNPRFNFEVLVVETLNFWMADCFPHNDELFQLSLFL